MWQARTQLRSLELQAFLAPEPRLVGSLLRKKPSPESGPLGYPSCAGVAENPLLEGPDPVSQNQFMCSLPLASCISKVKIFLGR